MTIECQIQRILSQPDTFEKIQRCWRLTEGGAFLATIDGDTVYTGDIAPESVEDMEASTNTVSATWSYVQQESELQPEKYAQARVQDYTTNYQKVVGNLPPTSSFSSLLFIKSRTNLLDHRTMRMIARKMDSPIHPTSLMLSPTALESLELNELAKNYSSPTLVSFKKIRQGTVHVLAVQQKQPEHDRTILYEALRSHFGNVFPHIPDAHRLQEMNRRYFEVHTGYYDYESKTMQL